MTSLAFDKPAVGNMTLNTVSKQFSTDCDDLRSSPRPFLDQSLAQEPELRLKFVTHRSYNVSPHQESLALPKS